MHPVLQTALQPLADEIAPLSAEEAQIPPIPGQGRWCAQQVMEHLILTFKLTTDSVGKQLKTGRIPKKRRNLLQFLLRMQTIGLGYMPDGVPAVHAVRPEEFTAQSGTMIAERFMNAAEAMDMMLVAARRKFGIQACGEHPFFGLMRVDEWRRYHAIHAEHHLPQLRAAIRYAQTAQTVRTA